MPQVLTRLAEGQVHAAIATLLAGLSLRLFVNDVFPGPDAVASDFLEPTDGGYAAVPTENWVQVRHDADARLVLQADPVTFVFQHSAGDFTIFGYWYFSSGADSVWSYVRLENPVAITVVGQTFSLFPTQRIGSLSG